MKTTHIACALLIGASAAQAATYYVSTSGSDSWNGSQSTPWRTIARAVRSDSPVVGGDTILVQPGTYTELVELQKNGASDSSRITLKANGSVTIVDPTPRDGWWQTGVIMAARRSHWNIEGFRVENASWGAITLRSCTNITISRCHTYRAGSSGIIALPFATGDIDPKGEAEVNSRNIRALDCVVEESNYLEDDATYTNRSGDQESISFWGVDGFEIARCRVFNGKTEGIDAKTGSRNGTIHHNEVYGCAAVSGLQGNTGIGRRNGGPAIYLDGNRAAMSNIQVFNNLVRDNKAEGIAVSDEDPNGGVSNIKIYNNVTYNNGILGVNSGSGINVSSGSGIDIYMNTSVNDVSGITIDGGAFGAPWPNDVEVRNNIVSGARYKTIRILESQNVTLDRNVYTTNINPAIDNAGNNTNLNIINNQIATANANLTSTWRLTASSPAVNAASSTGNLLPSTDYDNQSRPQNGAHDIGADEINVGSTGTEIAYETVDPAAEKSADVHRVFSEAAASGGSCAVLEANATGDYVTYSVPNVQNRTYKIHVRFKTGTNRGQVQMQISNTLSSGYGNWGAPFDLYGNSGYVEIEAATGTFASATTKYVRFTVTGKNALSGGFWVPIDRIRLVPQ